VVQFLVTNMGFTMVSVEANMPEAYQVNRFVLTGEGDPRQLLEGMHYWIWDTQEVLDLILWMREFNSSGKGRLEFTGFDMVDSAAAVAIVREFLSGSDPAYLPAFEAAAARVPADNTKLAAGQFAEASAAWDGVVRHLERLRGQGSAFDWSLQNARIIAENIVYAADNTTRDRSMAGNIQWILNRDPKRKIILWAHNSHVRTCRLDDLSASTRAFPMGAALRNAFPGEMFVFGMAFDEGSFHAALPGLSLARGGGLHTFTVPPAPQGSLDAAFASVGIPIFAIDLRHLPRKGPVANWWSIPRKSQQIGALFTDRTPAAAERLRFLLGAFEAPKCFDGMFFVRHTSAARALP
jgi:erythromycin esterase